MQSFLYEMEQRIYKLKDDVEKDRKIMNDYSNQEKEMQQATLEIDSQVCKINEDVTNSVNKINTLLNLVRNVQSRRQLLASHIKDLKSKTFAEEKVNIMSYINGRIQHKQAVNMINKDLSDQIDTLKKQIADLKPQKQNK